MTVSVRKSRRIGSRRAAAGYSRTMGPRVPSAICALLLVGCGASTAVRSTTAPPFQLPGRAHPQAVEPVAGLATAAQTKAVASTPVSDPKPTGPATITRGLAKGAPTDAEIKAAFARLQAIVRQYHLDRLNFSGVLLNPAQLPSGQWYVSIASFYNDFGSGLACGGILHPWTLGVANKTLPCGTEVTFLYNGRAIRVPVIDRGPYIAGRDWDLTAATAEALHFPGLGPIYWRIG